MGVNTGKASKDRRQLSMSAKDIKALKTKTEEVLIPRHRVKGMQGNKNRNIKNKEKSGPIVKIIKCHIQGNG